ANTALPQPPNTSQNVPRNSAVILCESENSFIVLSPFKVQMGQSSPSVALWPITLRLKLAPSPPVGVRLRLPQSRSCLRLHTSEIYEIYVRPAKTSLTATSKSPFILALVTYPSAPVSNAAVLKSKSSCSVRKTILVCESCSLIRCATS